MSLSLRRTAAVTAVALLAPVALGLSGCAKPETIRTYTPAHGVNADAGELKARNLVLVGEDGKALLSGAFLTPAGDTLRDISGEAMNPDGSTGKPLTASFRAVDIKPGNLTILGNDPKVEVSSPDLKPGHDVKMTLRFEKAGAMTLTVPVMDKQHPDYEGWPK